MPDIFRGLTENNTTDIQKLFCNNKVDVVVNVDQNFVYFYSREQVVVAPKGVKRVGGKIKSDKK